MNESVNEWMCVLVSVWVRVHVIIVTSKHSGIRIKKGWWKGKMNELYKCIIYECNGKYPVKSPTLSFSVFIR